MGPTRRLANTSAPVHGGFVKLPEAAIGVGLQHARKACEMRLRVFAFSVCREVISDARRIAAAPWSIIADIDPYAAFLDAFRHRIGAFAREIEDFDRRIVDVQAVGAENLRLDQVAERPQRRDPGAASIDQGRARNIRAETREDFALPIQGQMIVELGDEDMGDQTGAEHAAIDWARRRGRLRDFLAAPAGFLETHGLHHLQFSGNVVEYLGDVFAKEAQRFAALGAMIARIEHDAFARSRRVDTGLAASARLGFLDGPRLGFVAPIRIVGRTGRRHRHFEIFERQLQLLDLALDFFRTRTKLLPLEFRDPDLEGLNQGLVGANRSLQPCLFQPVAR